MSSVSLASRVYVSAMRELLGTGKTAAQVLDDLSGLNPGYADDVPTAELIAVKGLFMPNRVEGQHLSASHLEASLRRNVGKADTAGGVLTATATPVGTSFAVS